MRHFLQAGPIATLPLGMGMAAAQSRLIAATGGAHGALAGLLGAPRGAVAVASITVAADDDGDTAAGAQVASSGKVHWRSGPMESRRQRALREILCGQRRPRHRGLRGATSGSDLAVWTGVAPAFPSAGRVSTASATGALRPRTVARQVPCLPRFACQTRIAPQSIRRKPCGRLAKPVVIIPERQNPPQARIPSGARRQISTLARRR